MNRIIPALLLSIGLIGFSSTGMAGEGCIYGSSFKATSTETDTDETPATVIIVPEEETEQDPS